VAQPGARPSPPARPAPPPARPSRPPCPSRAQRAVGWNRRRHPWWGPLVSPTPSPNRLPLSLPSTPRARLLLPRAARFPLLLHLVADRNHPLNAGLAPAVSPLPPLSLAPSFPSPATVPFGPARSSWHGSASAAPARRGRPWHGRGARARLGGTLPHGGPASVSLGAARSPARRGSLASTPLGTVRRARLPGAAPRPGLVPRPGVASLWRGPTPAPARATRGGPALAPWRAAPCPCTAWPLRSAAPASARAAAVPLRGAAPCPLLGPSVCATRSWRVSAALRARARVVSWQVRRALGMTRSASPRS
jgi:hypothetical protein